MHVNAISHIDYSVVHWAPNDGNFPLFLQDKNKCDIYRCNVSETAFKHLIQGNFLN